MPQGGRASSPACWPCGSSGGWGQRGRAHGQALVPPSPMGVFPVPPALCPPGSLGREGKHKLQATTRSRPLQAVLIYVLTHKAPSLPHRDWHRHGTEGQGLSLPGCCEAAVTEGGLPSPRGAWSRRNRSVQPCSRLPETSQSIKVIPKGSAGNQLSANTGQRPRPGAKAVLAGSSTSLSMYC